MPTRRLLSLVLGSTMGTGCVYPAFDAGNLQSSGGVANMGGANSVGGQSSLGGNGNIHTGGAQSAPGGTSATSGAGGIGAIGGTTVTDSGLGGTSSASGGASSAAQPSSGGSTNASGGVTSGQAAGGALSFGGTPAIGSTFLTGGAPTMGGSKSVGGSNSTGGVVVTGGAYATTPGCPGTGGPTMVALPLDYCIDSTEVTQRQYLDWLNTSPSTLGQVSVCTWNTSYTPTINWTPETTADYPVVGVDWCDAYAYCTGVRKRLCGNIGGGSNGYSDYANATRSQWYAACTSNGTYSSTGYPYSNTYQPTYCNGVDANKGGAVPVATMPKCQSTVTEYAGVYDLSGNVWEWEDSCNGTTGQHDICRLRGGAFNLNGPGGTGDMVCGYGGNLTRNYAGNSTGFRCCS